MGDRDVCGESIPGAQDAGDAAGIFWAEFAVAAARGVGDRACAGIWIDAVRRWFSGGGNRGPAELFERFLFERDDIFHAGAGRCGAAIATGARARGRRGGIWIRIPRGDHRVSAFHLRIVLEPRDRDYAARFARGNAADSGRTFAAAQLSGRTRGAARVTEGLGALVGGIDGEPLVVSGARVFPVAARQPIVDRGAGGDSGYLRAAEGGNRGSVREAGATYVCDFAACGCGFVAGLWDTAEDNAV